MDLKIAVISDLHCHNKSKNNNIQESYLMTDTNLPDNQNPFISFKKFIEKRKIENADIEVDILIAPGDFTNRCDQDGMGYGWKIIKEIAQLTNAKVIIPTIGNHDVDSRGVFSPDPFSFIKSFDANFPFNSKALNSDFWSDGFVFYDGDNYRILIINSVFDHLDSKKAEHGSISQETLNKIEDKLKSLEQNKKRFNIAICHHHPIPHERNFLGTHDLIENGSLMVELVSRYDYQIVIHGHKHDPLIRYSQGGANSPIVFSSGSFSAFKTLLLQGMYNTFHIITLENIDKDDCANQGQVDTWFFTPSKGWDADVKNEYFLPRIGFGCRMPLKQLATQIQQWFHTGSVDNYEWIDFIPNFEMINYMLPDDKIKLGRFLEEFQIFLYPKFPSEPEIISFKRK